MVYNTNRVIKALLAETETLLCLMYYHLAVVIKLLFIHSLTD